VAGKLAAEPQPSLRPTFYTIRLFGPVFILEESHRGQYQAQDKDQKTSRCKDPKGQAQKEPDDAPGKDQNKNKDNDLDPDICARSILKQI